MILTLRNGHPTGNRGMDAGTLLALIRVLRERGVAFALHLTTGAIYGKETTNEYYVLDPDRELPSWEGGGALGVCLCGIIRAPAGKNLYELRVITVQEPQLIPLGMIQSAQIITLDTTDPVPLTTEPAP